MSAPRAAMIMAAGRGTRMRPLTDHRPKPLLRVGDQTLLDHALGHLRESGLTPVVVNVHHHAVQMKAHLAGSDVVISDESDLLLDTGGGVRKALPLLGPDPFVVLNSDAIFTGPAPVPVLLDAWQPGRMDALLLLVRRTAALAYTRPGDFFLTAEGRPARRGDAAGAPFVYAGVQIIKSAAFDDTPGGAFSTNFVWDRLLTAGRLFAVIHQGGWVDVGTPAGLNAAEQVLAGRHG